MRSKVLINPQRKRRIPRHFSWVDHRLVRNSYLEKCSCEALALYLFLLTVGDSEGLSYYRDESILKHLKLSENNTVALCRRELMKAGLISYLGGMYQVLDLVETDTSEVTFNERLKQCNKLYSSSITEKRTATAENVGSIIDRMFGGE